MQESTAEATAETEESPSVTKTKKLSEMKFSEMQGGWNKFKWLMN